MDESAAAVREEHKDDAAGPETESGNTGTGGPKVKGIELDKWQQDVIADILARKNICLRSGRQVGKSTAIAIGTAEFALRSPRSSIMVISATERQAYLLFSKILGHLLDFHKKEIKQGKDRPTKSEIKLKNSSIIRCLPTGMNGIGIRGYTVDILIADEAAFIPNEVWPAVTPMLASTKGNIVMLSTPRGVGDYFYASYHNPQFKTYHISSQDCPRITKEFLAFEKSRLSKDNFRREYLGEFVSTVGQWFPDSLIRELMTEERSNDKYGDFTMGVDVAAMGGDEFVCSIFRRYDDKFRMTENFVTENIMIPDAVYKILQLNREWNNLMKIYIDTGGIGVGVYHSLLRNDETRSKAVDINNAQRIVERGTFTKSDRKKILMKEALYVNAKMLMEAKQVRLLKDENIFFSLKSIMVDEEGKFSGTYTHIAEAIIRALWNSEDKINKPFISYI